MVLVSKRLGLALLLACVASVATACAAPTIPGANESSDVEEDEDEVVPSKKTKPKSEDKPAEDTDGTGSGAGTGTGTGTTPKDCSAEASADACFTCCDPSNAIEPAFEAFGNCVCATPGTCSAQCGTSYCNGQEPTAECKQCLDGATQCNELGETTCGASCKAAMTCVTTSKCAEKG